MLCILIWTVAFIAVNFISAVVGLVLFGSGIRDFFYQDQYKDYFEMDEINIFTLIAIGVGLFQFTVSYIGFCGAVKFKPCALLLYAIILILLIGVQMMVIGFTIACARSECAEDMDAGINRTFYKVNGVDAAAINIIQLLFNCCGAENISHTYGEGKASIELPSSCCGYFLNRTCSREDAFQKGCREQAKDWLIDHTSKEVGFLATLIVLEIVCIIVAIFIAVYNYDDWWC